MRETQQMDLEATYDKGVSIRPAARRVPAYRMVKRAFDVCFSSAMLVGLSPLMALTAAAIRLDSQGPAIFRQKRVGLNGKPILIYKFRSMHADAHDHPERYLDEGQMAVWRREQKVDDDPRVTRVGRMLRRTSLDELPQFVNVLSGDISVVGPRPVTEEETYEFGNDRDEVLSVRPGITGWWQVTDRNNATWESGRRQELELWYVRNASLGLDARIALMTIRTMFCKKNGR